MRDFSVCPWAWSSEADEGFSTVGIVLALLISLSLIFTCAKVYEVNTTAAQIQETTDAAVLAAENTVGEFYIVVTICDAITFTLSLTALLVLGIGIVCACLPPTAVLSRTLVDASAKIGKARDSFYDSVQSSLGTLQKALPFIANAKAQEVLAANSSEEGAAYSGIVILAPWEGESGEVLVFGGSDRAQKKVEDEQEELSDRAAEAEEAAQSANEWKAHAYHYDSGSQSDYCMYERAAKLAGMSGSENPFFSSVDTWSFQAALSRAQVYYRSRYEHEQPQDSSVDEQARSALRKRFYAYAMQEVGGGYVRETENSFEADFPLLPKNTDEMRRTSLYTEAVYPKTQNAEGSFVLHAWRGCHGCAEGTSAGVGSIQEMDGNASFSTCPYCAFAPSSMGKVAAASTNIENGFEYHYNEVAKAAQEYQKARAELDPLRDEITQTVNSLFDVVFSGIEEACSKRIELLPPGHWGAVAIVVDTSAPASRFPSAFVASEGVASLGVRAALSASTLVCDPSDEGKNVLTTFLSGLESQTVVTGGIQTVLDVWSGMLGVYAGGHDALLALAENVLDGIPLASASGLGTWAADELEERIDELGYSPPDLSARKAVLVNSTYVLEADDSAFSARLLSVKSAAIQYQDGAVNSAVSAAESLAASVVERLDAEFEIATIVLIEGAVEIPITVSLPSFVADGLARAFQGGLDRLYSIAVTWTGTRQWR